MKKEKQEKEKKNKMVDRIIEIILLIIIILLLIHNCEMRNKDKKGNTPSGNVNIIEILCDDSNKCKDNPKTGLDDVTNSKTDNNNPTPKDDGEFAVYEGNIKWSNSTKLKIFEDSYYEFKDKIAPESSNAYQFIVKNSTSYNLKYNMNFFETNPYNMNLKYKLKKNGKYIISEYVSYNKLNLKDQILNAKNYDTYLLEWKWVSSDHDTAAGKAQANYKLKINLKAESI